MCGNPVYAADLYCDDENNNEGCNYDNGACCERTNTFENKYDYCTNCTCLDPAAKKLDNEGCSKPEYAGDIHCDDGNNNADCNWDNGACCNTTVEGWNSYCSDCK